METQSILKIKELHATITKNLEAYKEYQKEQVVNKTEPLYGSEQEYSINGIIAGIKNILTDVAYLVKAHNLFIKISTYNERSNLINALSNLNSYIVNRSNSYIVNQLDSIKTILRFYNLRIDKDRFMEFNTEIDELRKKAIILDEEIAKVREKLGECTTLNTEISSTQDSCNTALQELQDSRDSFIETLQSFTEEYSDFTELAKKAKQNEAIISDKLVEINEEKETFDGFIEKITDRELVLEKQAQTTAKYDKRLEDYAVEQDKKLAVAINLIEEAKRALNYKNAEGLSAAFSEKLASASSRHATLWWLAGAIFFILATLFIGIWIVTGWGLHQTIDQNQMILNLVGRLSMIPFTIVAAVFCANQYIKQKNIIEDYAYKTTIAKSIIAFSEELRDKDPERYAEYISTVLKEIHQDPLRKREKNNEDFKLNKESAGIIEKVIVLLQSAITKS